MLHPRGELGRWRQCYNHEIKQQVGRRTYVGAEAYTNMVLRVMYGATEAAVSLQTQTNTHTHTRPHKPDGDSHRAA